MFTQNTHLESWENNGLDETMLAPPLWTNVTTSLEESFIALTIKGNLLLRKSFTNKNSKKHNLI